MIRVPPNRGNAMARYRGRLVRTKVGPPGADWRYIEGEKVSICNLDEWFSEDVVFEWRGREFLFGRYVDDDTVTGMFLGGDMNWANANGLLGNQYDGWYCKISESDIDRVFIDKFDILGHWQYKKEMGQQPPAGLFTYRRPATSEEWVPERKG